MLQQDEGGVGGGDGDGAVDDGDDDPDEVQRDDDDDDFPSPGGNFLGRISLLESSFSLDGFRPMEAAEYFVDDLPSSRFSGGQIYAKGQPGGGPRWPRHSSAWPHLGPRPSVAWGPPCSPGCLLLAGSGI